MKPYETREFWYDVPEDYYYCSGEENTNKLEGFYSYDFMFISMYGMMSPVGILPHSTDLIQKPKFFVGDSVWVDGEDVSMIIVGKSLYGGWIVQEPGTAYITTVMEDAMTFGPKKETITIQVNGEDITSVLSDVEITSIREILEGKKI